jgi:hypothetical protein
MRNAPAVSYPVGRSYFEGVLLTCMAVLITLVLGAWTWLSQTLVAWHIAGSVLGCGAVFGAVWSWQRTPSGILAWDGTCWTWTSRGVSQVVVIIVLLDFQKFLVLTLRTSGGAKFWIWPQRQAFHERWLAFRRAVFN